MHRALMVMVLMVSCAPADKGESRGQVVQPVVPKEVQQQQVASQPVAPVPVPPPALPDLPARPEAQIATAGNSKEAVERQKTWLTEPFRCRAISTVRFRRCQFEATDKGHRLKFQKKDVVCNDVEFDDNGDPRKLVGCRSSWIKIPANNTLRPDKNRKIWSGSHKGWRWKGDGERYCCPGIWLEAPSSLLGS